MNGHKITVGQECICGDSPAFEKDVPDGEPAPAAEGVSAQAGFWLNIDPSQLHDIGRKSRPGDQPEEALQYHPKSAMTRSYAVPT